MEKMKWSDEVTNPF